MQQSPELYAAVDLGSNSFHMIVAEIINNQLHVIDSHKDMVRLANGLDQNGFLSKSKMDTGIESLQKIEQRIRHIPKSHLRIVGTNTLRKAKNSDEFMQRAANALGKPIDIISGREEARILYLGVAHSLPNDQGQRLVIDIGGGSTELIIGQNFKPIFRESLHMGCVSYTRRFFTKKGINQKSWDKAVLQAKRQLIPIVSTYKSLGWNVVIGASGSMRSTAQVIQSEGMSHNGIESKSLKLLIDSVLIKGGVEHLLGLSTRRAPVFIGGLAIIKALFDSLDFDCILGSNGALREGIVYDLSGRLHHNDVRKRTIEKLSFQFETDKQQSKRVKTYIDNIVNRSNIKLTNSQHNLLSWAAQLHELGLSISHSHFEKHAAYILINADMPGFAKQEQLKLAVLVALQRRKLKKEWIEKLNHKQFNELKQSLFILRLSVLINRSRMPLKNNVSSIIFDANQVTVKFKSHWLKEHPLSAADLKIEIKHLLSININLVVS